MPLGHLGESTRALAGGKHDQPSARRRLRQLRRQAMRGMRGGNRGSKQRFQEFARLRHHDGLD
jgi:hypothetical protein